LEPNSGEVRQTEKQAHHAEQPLDPPFEPEHPNP
jgi:hypothetical protein